MLNWSVLRKVSASNFVQSMYGWIFIVPVLAKTFEFVGDESLKFVVFEQPLLINPTLPFSWQIFYFSALLLASGNLIILTKCPKIIKDHLSYQSYINEGKTIKQLSQYSKDIKFEWSELAETVHLRLQKLQSRDSASIGGSNYNHQSLNDDDPVHYFWPIFESAEAKFKFTRIICSILYFVGFGLFSFVIAQNTWVVINFIVNSIAR